MKSCCRLACSCVALIATAVMLATIVPAEAVAVAVPGWRQVLSRHYGPSSLYSFYSAVTATAKNSAWVFGGFGPDQLPPAGLPVAIRWNGKVWRDVPLPRQATGDYLNASAPSSNDIWTVTSTAYVLHWNGKSWSMAVHLPDAGEVTGITALSATDVWVFGGGGVYGGIGTWHFNGKTWRLWQGTADGIESASAVSTTNIWAIGSTIQNPANAIDHFNGRAWEQVNASALSGLSFFRIDALTATNIWVSADPAGDELSGYLVHFNGRTWKRFNVPWKLQAVSLATDGRGGLWMTAPTSTNRSYIVHRTAAGIWSRKAIEADMWDLAFIPGSTSLWGAGGQGTNAVVWAYGAV